MARSYPAEFRRKVLDLVEAGRPVDRFSRATEPIQSPSLLWTSEYGTTGPDATGL